MNAVTVLCPFGLDTGLLSKAVSFSAPVRVLVPNGQEDLAARLGAEFVHTCAPLPEDDRAIALWLEQLLKRWKSRIVLAPATVRMRSIMPQLAWRMGAGLTADCTALTMEENSLLQTRPAFGNSLMADIRTRSAVQMATVRPGTFATIETPKDPVITKEVFSSAQTLVETIETRPLESETPLNQAQIILAGGLGIGSKEGFEKLSRIAAKLGAGVAASRSAVDAGFAPYRCQVGMTGVTVCPKVYIAVGISGAVQHLAGMSGAQKIIAINTDPKAPIFGYADYGIVGDWEQVIQELEALL